MPSLSSFSSAVLPRFWPSSLWSLLSSDQSGERVSTRISSIESFRVLAIFAVILWHTHFLSTLSQLAAGNFFILLNGYLVWWIGVPYFFITAGYFFQRSILTQGNPAAQFHRQVSSLAQILLVWLCIYIVTPADWPAEVLHHGLWQSFSIEAQKNIQLLETRHLWVFIGGDHPIWHLWFLPALIFSLAIVMLLAMSKLQQNLLIIAVGVYVLILMEEGISSPLLNAPVPLGQWIIAIPLVALGGWLAGRREQFSASLAWSLILGGYALALLEGVVMHLVFESPMRAIVHHAYLGGVCLSLGIFLLALAKPQLGHSTPFPFLGGLTLGIYVAHVLVMYTITPFVWKLADKVPLWELGQGIMVYLTSVLFVLVLARIPVLRFLVMKPARERDKTAIPEQ